MTTVKPIYRHRIAGLGSVGSYQVSGHPFLKRGEITGTTETLISFETVARSVLIKNTHASNTLKIHFAAAADCTSTTVDNYWTLEGETSIELRVKCAKIYLTPSATLTYELFAELTTIPATEMYDLSYAGITGISEQSHHLINYFQKISIFFFQYSSEYTIYNGIERRVYEKWVYYQVMEAQVNRFGR